MEQYKIHFQNISESAIQLTFIPSDRTEDTLRQDIEEHGVVIGDIMAHSLSWAKNRIVKLLEHS